MVSKTPQTLEALLREVLPWIDEHLATKGTAVKQRPLAAARQVVDHFVLAIENDTKDNYLTKPWFAGIFQLVYKWYEQRYGQTLTQPRQASVRGVVAHFDTPYLIRVPLILTEQNEDGTLLVRFLAEVLPTELPLTWLESPPPLKALSAKRRQMLLAAVVEVADALRSINNNLNTANYPEPKISSMGRSVVRHFEKAASDATSGENASASLAVWELQMACEKTMKVYLSQKQIKYPFVHDLRQLQKLALDDSDWSVATSAMAFMPSEGRVMAWRYAELPPPRPKEFERFYLSALRICSLYAARMSRTFVFKNFAVHLRKPPWHGMA